MRRFPSAAPRRLARGAVISAGAVHRMIAVAEKNKKKRAEREAPPVTHVRPIRVNGDKVAPHSACPNELRKVGGRKASRPAGSWGAAGLWVGAGARRVCG